MMHLLKQIILIIILIFPILILFHFQNCAGNLNWPILNGKVVDEFGENLNSKLNTVTLNYGIDIKASRS